MLDTRYIDYLILALHNFFELDFILRRIKENPRQPDILNLFGGCSLILSGDHFQLAPVNDKSIISENLSNMTASEQIAYNIVRSIKDAVILQQNYRQTLDSNFQILLMKIRYGNVDDSDFTALSTRIVANIALTKPLKDFKGLILFGKNSHVKIFNNLIQERTIESNIRFFGNELPVHLLEARDSRPYAEESNLTADEAKDLKKKHADYTGGLEGVLKLTVGDIISIRKNIDYRLGLVTNARGEVVGFGILDGEVVVVFVRMFNKLTYTTNYDFTDCQNIVPIFRYKEEFSYRSSAQYKNGKTVLRDQFPLSLNYTNTVHSVQALTFEGDLLCDVNSCHFNPRLVYTAISRCTKLSNLYFLRAFEKKAFRKPTADMLTHNDLLLNNYKHTVIKYAKFIPDDFDLSILDFWHLIDSYLTSRYTDNMEVRYNDILVIILD
jgi:hypothetical protein